VTTVLKAHLHLTDLNGPWRHDGLRWVSGGSWIEPFNSPALEVVTAVGDGTTLLVVREVSTRTSQSPTINPARLRSQMSAWPTDFVTVDLDRASVMLTAGARGSAPVFLTAAGEELDLSWWLPDLRTHLTADRIDRENALRFLTGQEIYSNTTLWPNVARLTERAQARWTVAGLTVVLPDAAPHYRARTLAEGANPIDAYDILLRSELYHRQLPAEHTFVEVSGGLDSANVALTARDVLPGTRAYGLLIAGAAAEQQRLRRQQLVDHLGLADLPIETLPHAPFSGHLHTGSFIDPLVEPYRECLISHASDGSSRYRPVAANCWQRDR